MRPRRLLLALAAILLLTAVPLHAASVMLVWDPNPEPDITGYRLSYGTAPGTYTTTVDVGNVTTWTLNLSAGPRYVFVVAAVNASGVSPYSNEVTSDQTLPPVPLPVPWSSQDVGGPIVAGSATVAAGTWTISGAGSDIWDASDQFQFVSQPLTGDGAITARVDSLVNTNAWAKAGVMIREDGTAGAPNALAYLRAGGALIFSRRVTRGGVTTSTSGAPLVGAAPYWVRLTRAGNLVTASASPTGVTWTVLGSMTIPITATARWGLAVTSLVPATVTTGVFSQVSVIATTPPKVPAPATTFRVIR